MSILNRSFSPTLFLMLLLLITASCITTEQTVREPSSPELTVTEAERPLPYPIDIPEAYQWAVENGTRNSDGSPGPNYWQNTASYMLHAEIDPESHTLTGSSSAVYNNNSPDDLEVIVVELAQNLHKAGTPKKEITEITGGKNISVVTVNASRLEEISWLDWWSQRSTGFVIEGTQMYIFPDEPVLSGESVEFGFEWSFKIPAQGASGRMGRSRDNLYFIAYWYPQIAVYDDVYGWMEDDFLGNAEFYQPFADYELHVTMPSNWLVMGSGEFINPEETLAPNILERYKMAGNSEEPITIAAFDDLDSATVKPENGKLTWKFSSNMVRDVAFSATQASQWDGAITPVGDQDGDGDMNYTRIHSFYRESAPLWTEQTTYAQHAITFLSDYTGLNYPWPHMTSVEGADIIGGGMEFPMMTVIGDYNNAGAVRLYGVTAHELAHMWFPMIINTNERRYTWIDEGYTTFHTNEANMDYIGDRFSHEDVFSGYLQIAGSDLEGEIMRWSDYHYPGPAYGVASYPKPASVLIALRGVLGEETFNNAHQELIRRWNYKHAYPWDIFNTFEDVSGRDLSWFWRSWYFETWTLDHSISDVYEENNSTVIVVHDLGNVPMPVYIEITLENGAVLRKSLDVNHWLQGNRTGEITLNNTVGVISIKIDPDNHFPYVNTSNLTWTRDF